MGLKHNAKKGTVIEANGVKITVLRGSPQLDISAPHGVQIKTGFVEVTRRQSVRPYRRPPDRP